MNYPPAAMSLSFPASNVTWSYTFFIFATNIINFESSTFSAAGLDNSTVDKDGCHAVRGTDDHRFSEN